MGLSDYWNLAKGWFGYTPEQKVGKDLGGYLGQLGSEYIPIPGINGKQFGEWAGSFLPFKEGGRIGSWQALRDPIESVRPPPFVGSWDDYDGTGMRRMMPFKQGGYVRSEPLSFSNIRDQVISEGWAPMKKGGRVKKRKH